MNDDGTPGCKFCDILNGRAETAKVFSNDSCLAFLDTRPIFPGHTLVVPRAHHQTLPELPADMLLPLFSAVRLLSRAVEEAMEAEGTFIGMNNRVSQSVPHLHVHVVPRRRHDGLRGFFWPRQKYGNEDEVENVREKIVDAVRRLHKAGEWER